MGCLSGLQDGLLSLVGLLILQLRATAAASSSRIDRPITSAWLVHSYSSSLVRTRWLMCCIPVSGLSLSPRCTMVRRHSYTVFPVSFPVNSPAIRTDSALQRNGATIQREHFRPDVQSTVCSVIFLSADIRMDITCCVCLQGPGWYQ